MFKQVEYVGFEGQPELRARAETLAPVLAGEIHSWRDDVEVKWSPAPEQPRGSVKLTLSLSLPNGVSETHSGTIAPADLVNDSRSASRCGRVWYDLLGSVVRQLDRRVEASLLELETAEV